MEIRQNARCRRPYCADATTESRILKDLGYFGHFLHLHAGGRSGKQHMLVRLLQSGDSVTQRELQETTPISSAAVSEVLAKLESEGYITRTRSTTDKRQLDVTLTEAGREEAKECAKRRAEFEADALSVLDEDEKRLLLGMLDRLAGHWEEIEEREGAMQQ
ncbi:MarR family winged helix-turn-helix transcriptional regulator [Olsenella sp. Marseille-P4559]|uniref:MarR family winged helix-turn-helix transcriptional regulator n=1 Tax=Olsenella sp. Marseille-P4559 TaxID=2364795 RepID=UPI001F5FC5C5|nr:MarR family transcriptional regulator [Olsenella sp. Marseille-P4559]